MSLLKKLKNEYFSILDFSKKSKVIVSQLLKKEKRLRSREKAMAITLDCANGAQERWYGEVLIIKRF